MSESCWLRGRRLIRLCILAPQWGRVQGACDFARGGAAAWRGGRVVGPVAKNENDSDDDCRYLFGNSSGEGESSEGAGSSDAKRKRKSKKRSLYVVSLSFFFSMTCPTLSFRLCCVAPCCCCVVVRWKRWHL